MIKGWKRNDKCVSFNQYYNKPEEFEESAHRVVKSILQFYKQFEKGHLRSLQERYHCRKCRRKRIDVQPAIVTNSGVYIIFSKLL